MDPYANILRPERFRAVRAIAIAPIRVNSFGLAKGSIADTASPMFRMLREFAGASFQVVPMDSAAAAEDSSGMHIWDASKRRTLTDAGVEAVLFPSVTYVTSNLEYHVEVRLQLVDVADFSVLAESGDDGVWKNWFNGAVELSAPMRATLERAVRRSSRDRTPRGSSAGGACRSCSRSPAATSGRSTGRRFP